MEYEDNPSNMHKMKLLYDSALFVATYTKEPKKILVCFPNTKAMSIAIRDVELNYQIKIPEDDIVDEPTAGLEGCAAFWVPKHNPKSMAHERTEEAEFLEYLVKLAKIMHINAYEPEELREKISATIKHTQSRFANLAYGHTMN